MKNSSPLQTNPVRHRAFCVRSANITWHLETAHKLIEQKNKISGVADGCRMDSTWLKFSDINLADTNYKNFEAAINDFIFPLQVCGDYGSENMLIIKHVSILRNYKFRGFISVKSRCKTRIEILWRECKTIVMDYFNKEFTILELLGSLNTSDEIELSMLCFVCMNPIKDRLQKIRSCFNNHPLSSKSNKVQIICTQPALHGIR